MQNNIPMDYVLGIDYGDTNIGLALGRNKLSTPIKVISGKNTEAAIAELNRIVVENKVLKFVMGLPLTPEGKETKQSLKIRRFAKILKIRSKKPVEFVNEASTTEEAETEMLDTGISKKRRGVKDAYSAALILKRYYDSMPS